jgi:hypothetical protein
MNPARRWKTRREPIPRLLALVLVLVVVSLGFAAAPASAEVDNDVGGWIVVVATGDFGDVSPELTRLKYWFDSQIRLYDDTDGYGQSLLRPALGWGIFDRGALWIGYNWIHTRPSTGPTSDEHQVWEQFTWSEPSGSVSRTWRTRFEQRFSDKGDDVGLRLRQLFRTGIPIRKGSRFEVVAWDEVFFHLRDTDWGLEAGFDENRFFVGLGWKVAPSFGGDVELGYMNRYIDQSVGQNVLQHVISVTFGFR